MRRQHNFDRWWTWDFQNDKPGKEPSVATLDLFHDPEGGDYPAPGGGGDFSVPVTPEQIHANPFGVSTDENMDRDDPMLFYHGTYDFRGTRFETEKQGARDPGYLGKGFYFTPMAHSAESYAETVDEHLAIQGVGGPVAKVYSVDSNGERGELLEEIDSDHTGFQKSGYPETEDGLRQYAEEEYADSMVAVETGGTAYSPEILPVYLSLKNPLNLNPRKLTQEMLDQLKEGVFRVMDSPHAAQTDSEGWTKEGITSQFAHLEMQAGIMRSETGQFGGVSLQQVSYLAEGLGLDLSELAQEAGFDAIVNGAEVIVFDPKQIKSATGNIGLFNPRSDDFLTQLDQKKTKKNQQIAQIMAQQQMRQSAA
jgi:hypothetical protein